MEMYTEAYRKYSEKCQRFGITGIDFIDFIQSLTLQQIQMMVMDLDCINWGGTWIVMWMLEKDEPSVYLTCKKADGFFMFFFTLKV